MFTIMVVEDDRTLFEEIKDRLFQWSYKVIGITDFSNVLQKFIDGKPDLIFKGVFPDIYPAAYV